MKEERREEEIEETLEDSKLRVGSMSKGPMSKTR